MRSEYTSAYDSTLVGWNMPGAANRRCLPQASPKRCCDDREQFENPGIWNCTLDEVGQELGVNREQVRRIEQQALKKCRAFCKAQGWRLEDLLWA